MHPLLAVRFWFAVQANTTENWTDPNFGIPKVYISFEIKPSSEGGLTQGTKAKIRLTDRGILQFWEQLQKPRERTIYEKRSKAEEDEEGLRAYFLF